MKEIEPLPMANEAQAEAPVEQSMGEDGTNLSAMIEARLNELPDNQKAFLSQYLSAPETSAILGLILGKEALDHFIQFADPSMTLQVVPRPQEQASPQGGQPGPQGPQQGLMVPPTQAPTRGPALGPM